MRRTSALCIFIAVAALVLSCTKDGGNVEGEAGMFGRVPNKNITLVQLQEMFDNMKKNTKWDLTKSMLWGYFFTDKDPAALEKAKDELVKRGYRFVDIYRAEKDDPSVADYWWLHVEKRRDPFAEVLGQTER